MGTGHHIIQVLSQIYIIVLVLISLFLPFRFRQADRASGFLCILIWLVSLTELVAMYVASRYHNNMPVYTIYGFFEFTLISLYFNYSIDTFRKQHIGYFIALAGLITGITNSVLYQSIFSINTIFIFLECIGIVCMSLYSFYRLLLTSTPLRLYERVHFWFPCIFLFNWCATLSYWGLYSHFWNTEKEKIPVLNISLIVVNILTYLSFSIVFLFYPKMKNTHD